MAHEDQRVTDGPAGRRRLVSLPRAVSALQTRASAHSQSHRDGAPGADTDPKQVESVPPDMARVLAALPHPAMWVTESGAVAWCHPALLELHLVRRGMVNNPEISVMVQRAGVRDRPAEGEITVRRPGRRQARVRLRVRVTPMSAGSAMVIVEDITEAQRLDHARRDFVANVSHELKTPVGALSLLAEAAHQAGGDAEAVGHFTQRMQMETRRLTTMINDLMDLSRLEGVEPLGPMGRVRVDAVVSQACDDVSSLAQDKGITFLRGGLPELEVEGVAEQLTAAVRNLIVNAVNYSPPATKVAVTTGVTQGQVTIAVTDQGIGIPRAELDRIFERFYRVDPARSRVTGGTGLGLSIVKHVCANHGGDCEVWSRVGEGSTFTICLPALHSSAAHRGQGGPDDGQPSTAKEEQ